MFWIVDNIIMKSNNKIPTERNDSSSPMKFRRKHQNIYLPVSNGDTQDLDEPVDITSDSAENLTVL